MDGLCHTIHLGKRRYIGAVVIKTIGYDWPSVIKSGFDHVDFIATLRPMFVLIYRAIGGDR